MKWLFSFVGLYLLAGALFAFYARKKKLEADSAFKPDAQFWLENIAAWPVTLFDRSEMAKEEGDLVKTLAALTRSGAPAVITLGTTTPATATTPGTATPTVIRRAAT